MNDLSSQHSDYITGWMAWCHSLLSLWYGMCDLTSIYGRESETAHYQCPGRLWERLLLLIHLLPGAKRQGCEANHSTPCCAWIKGKVELHLHSTHALEAKWFTGGYICFMEILYLLYTQQRNDVNCEHHTKPINTQCREDASVQNCNRKHLEGIDTYIHK